MKDDQPLLGFWSTVKVLLVAARVRSKSRGKHQQKLLRQRQGRKGEGLDLGCFAVPVLIAFGLFINGIFGMLFSSFRDAALEAQAGLAGIIVLDSWQYHQLDDTSSRHDVGLDMVEKRLAKLKAASVRDSAAIRQLENQYERLRESSAQLHAQRFHSIASDRVVRDHMGDVQLEEKKIRSQFERYGIAGFVDKRQLVTGKNKSGGVSLLVQWVSLIVVLWWFVMLAFQGEGLEMDFQRRRHPMWEWLLSHPVKPGAVFMAEMLSPLAANPFFLGAPAFWVALHYSMYGEFLLCVLTGTLAGVPLAVAACCTSKALEVGVMLRLSPRSRGAVLGIMSWLGYSAFILGILAANARELLVIVAQWIEPLSRFLPLPLFGWLVGYGMGEPSVWKGVAVCWGVAAAVIFAAVKFSAYATNTGLAGGFGSVASAPKALSQGSSSKWLRDPLHRKELLWFWRDRGALVPVFLIPMTMAAPQVFNFRGLVSMTMNSWHTIAAVAVIFGTYFLFILGPRSLISEGAALWLPLTWPRGLEPLLKAKARLWWAIACGLVFIILLVDAIMFPADIWRIMLIAVGWFLFSGSLAEKSVTLVTMPSSSGEPEPVPWKRRWAASLGTFTFAAGVIMQRWSLAFVGIVFSWLTSAAMWQNFRARLPYLFDPWSEEIPKPPTLMHSMIAISGMTEAMAVIFGMLLAFMGKDQAVAAHTIAYGVVGLVTMGFLLSWLDTNGVPLAAIWQWPNASNHDQPKRRIFDKMAIGIIIGTALGFVGLGYLWVLHHVPWLYEHLLKDSEAIKASAESKYWFFALAVLMAPPAEEFLFRGMLLRALDREWGGWRAIVASSLFFAIYHPPVSWIPVAVVGFANAWLYRRSGHLMPCILAHMAYNAVIVWGS